MEHVHGRGRFLAGAVALGAGTLVAGGTSFAQPAGRPYRIDVHYHLGGQAYFDFLKSHHFTVQRGMTTELALADMDRAGIATSILSVPGPGVWFGDPEESRRWARLCNEYLKGLSIDHPGRFGFWATLPLPDIPGALAEIAYALDVLEADGVQMWTDYGDKWLGDPLFAPVFDELNRRKAVIYTHPTRADCCAKILPEIPSAVIEYGADTARTIASLVFNGVATRCPDMRIIFSHDGGALTSLVERFIFEARNPKEAGKLPHGVMYELQKFYYETAQAFRAPQMAALMKMVPLSQILFGTDFPYRESPEQVVGLRESGVLTDAQIRAIQVDNAVRLLPRLRP